MAQDWIRTLHIPRSSVVLGLVFRNLTPVPLASPDS